MNSSERVVNLKKRDIRDFVFGDTIYIKKIKNGFSLTHYCEFVKYEKGTVSGKVIRTEPNDPTFAKGELVRGKINKCFLWGKTEDDNWPRCHWFKKGKIEN